MSDDPSKVDFGLMMRQQSVLMSDMRVLRDDMLVLTAIIQRMDGTLAGLVNEMRATHSQLSRMDRRVRELEGRPE